MAASATLIAKCRAQRQSGYPTIRFTHDSSTYDSDVLEVSDIHRNSSLSSGQAIVSVDNTDGGWNGFSTSSTAMGCAASIALKFSDDAETLCMFTGTVERVEFLAPHGSVCKIYLRDKMAKMLNQRIGDGATEQGDTADYFSASSPGVPDMDTSPPFHPADLVWGLLIDHGGLDDTESSANTDLAYTNWAAWKAALSSVFRIRAWFTGQTIRDALLRIAQMTDSYIWINGAGKVDFRYGGTSGETYTASNSRFISLEQETVNMINATDIYSGYDLESGRWLGTTAAADTAGSQSQYGVFPYTDRDTNIWPNSLDSAEIMESHIHASYAYPVKILTLEVPLQGFLNDISYQIDYTNSTMSMTNITPILEDATYRMSGNRRWTAEQSFRWDW